MYVSIEYIDDGKYQFSRRHIDTARGIDSVVMYFGGLMEGVYSKDFNLAFYNYQTNNWSFAGNRDKSVLTKLRGTIKFSAEISKCKE